MNNIYNLIARAHELRKETQLGSISPERVGSILEDTCKYLNEAQIFADALIQKVYATEEAFNNDTERLSDLTGKPMKAGVLIYIYETEALYRYDGGNSKTLIMENALNAIPELAEIKSQLTELSGKIDEITVDSSLSTESENPVQNKVITEELNRVVEMNEIKFTNPVGPHCPDPCFWKGDDGYFYIKGTGRIATVLRTRNFVDYEDTGRTFLSESALNWISDNYGHFSTQDDTELIVPHCWAPFVIKIGNNWILYLAIVERSGNHHEPVDGAAHIVAFTSKIPYGDFTNPVTIVSDGDFKLTNSVVWNNVIDPFVYCDPKDQKLYLVAGSSYSIGRLELTDDGLATVLEKRVGNKCVRMAGLTISSDSTREYVYEGAYIYARPHNGETYYYLFASKGHYAEDNYGLIVGRSKVLTNNPEDTEKWRDIEGISMINKNPNVNSRVILRGHSKNSGKPWGPGHCAGIFETSDGKTWMLYHCHTGDGTNDRQLFIQEVLWDISGWPYFKGGTPVDSGVILQNIITENTKVGFDDTELRNEIAELQSIIATMQAQLASLTSQSEE